MPQGVGTPRQLLSPGMHDKGQGCQDPELGARPPGCDGAAGRSWRIRTAFGDLQMERGRSACCICAPSPQISSWCPQPPLPRAKLSRTDGPTPPSSPKATWSRS